MATVRTYDLTEEDLTYDFGVDYTDENEVMLRLLGFDQMLCDVANEFSGAPPTPEVFRTMEDRFEEFLADLMEPKVLYSKVHVTTVPNYYLNSNGSVHNIYIEVSVLLEGSENFTHRYITV